MNGFLYKLQNFMYGRNGVDRIGIWSLIAGLILSFIGAFFWPLRILSYALYIYAIFRMLSKNLYKRQIENQWFVNKTAKLASWWSITRLRFKERKTYKYVRCQNCKQWSRVPKGRGKVEVTCRSCKTRFIKKV